MLVSENEWLGCARKSESRRPPAPRLLEMLLRWPAVRRPREPSAGPYDSRIEGGQTERDGQQGDLEKLRSQKKRDRERATVIESAERRDSNRRKWKRKKSTRGISPWNSKRVLSSPTGEGGNRLFRLGLLVAAGFEGVKKGGKTNVKSQ
ncbi:hypothetical protein CIRG_07769 [Coccidioides immitis RMSCC 2394]|uniref:Uncharacterized protein n=1 Tax=Coccidioides immitis RMSCC 2394 TaxID=404692 RepID=A0A0J6YMF5_COCIT|nr:hypothetical protein CIRG_07769 [Coccidioides immitis RMSCC 2394]